MIPKESLFQVRKDIESYIGKEVNIKASTGRNKQVDYEGWVIDSASQNLFSIKNDSKTYKVTYSYADVLTNALQINLVDTGEQIANYEFEVPKKYTRL